MGLTSLQVCMDSSDWFQGTIHEETGMDSSSPSGGDMLTCSRPLIERRLRPPHDQALKCPRCDSTHTKFCYYNNYSLSQPRYFCKTCRRYWTKGGTLRNIPVGGGCRKNKKVSKKTSTNNNNNDNHLQQPINLGSSSSSLSSYNNNPTDLHLSFPDHHHQVHFSHLNNILGNPSFMESSKYSINGMLENPTRPIDFMESKLEAIVGSSSCRNYDFMGNSSDLGIVNGLGDNQINHPHHHHHHHHGLAAASNYQGLCSPFGISIDGNNGALMQLPYDQDQNSVDVKPNTKLLSLEWHDQQAAQGCSHDGGKDTFGYLNSLGASWNGMINGYGS